MRHTPKVVVLSIIAACSGVAGEADAQEIDDGPIVVLTPSAAAPHDFGLPAPPHALAPLAQAPRAQPRTERAPGPMR